MVLADVRHVPVAERQPGTTAYSHAVLPDLYPDLGDPGQLPGDPAVVGRACLLCPSDGPREPVPAVDGLPPCCQRNRAGDGSRRAGAALELVRPEWTGDPRRHHGDAKHACCDFAVLCTGRLRT